MKYACPKKCKEKPKCCRKTCCLPSKAKHKFFSITYVDRFYKKFINIIKVPSSIYISKMIFKLKKLYKEKRYILLLP